MYLRNMPFLKLFSLVKQKFKGICSHPGPYGVIYGSDSSEILILPSVSGLPIRKHLRYPILSVIAYTGLAVLAGTVGFRVFKTIEAQVKKTNGENPFQEYLAKDVQVPQERIHAQVDVLAEHGTALFNQLKRLIFVENIVDSVKFALILWALTYIGCWFSGFAIVILGESKSQ
ncbi:Reticulon [Teladorsagia circumcincta]|uniref:Reticulon-like protein n=1 Tax=Teladorsagia circumcincta TaxID=45464 RepID=A0A2G9U4N9_TELCI|nr:Reticulon [Teladorsagia circumcincta]